jgi:hypothetical protein
MSVFRGIPFLNFLHEPPKTETERGVVLIALIFYGFSVAMLLLGWCLSGWWSVISFVVGAVLFLWGWLFDWVVYSSLVYDCSDPV